MVNFTHTENGGKTYVNVAGLTPIPGALKNAKPEPVHKNVVFDLDKPDMAVFSKFHEKLQEAIKKSPEWAKVQKPTAAAHGAAPSSGFDDMDDRDVPF